MKKMWEVCGICGADDRVFKRRRDAVEYAKRLADKLQGLHEITYDKCDVERFLKTSGLDKSYVWKTSEGAYCILRDDLI